jgi:hypothetical protein
MQKKEAEEIIDYILRENYEPTDWEAQFLDSVKKSSHPEITPKMAACLLRIYERATGSGQYQRRHIV